MDDEDRTPRLRTTRPQSTVAQSFAADLDSMFGLGLGSPEVDALSQTVEEKKRDVSSGQSELEQLEAKLRETEQRLARVSRQNSPSRQPQANTGAAMHPPSAQSAEKQAHPLAQKPTYPADRPPTGGGPGVRTEDSQNTVPRMPGGMSNQPQQPHNRDDYVMVDDTGSGR